MAWCWLASLAHHATLLLASCTPHQNAPGTQLNRTGDEIVVCGQLFHIGTPVVTWMDEGGYDAYRADKRFGPWDAASWDATEKATTRRYKP